MRECGDCTACCTALRIDELNAPAYTPCQHLGDKGCSIYEDRPHHPCRVFTCAWLQGHMGEDERPDKAGGIVWQTKENERIITVVSELEGMEPSSRLLRFAIMAGAPVRIESP